MRAIAVVLGLLLVGLVPPASAVGEPREGTYFEYEYEQRVDDGTGEYYGWWEKTTGEGRYEVLSWGPEEALMRCRYTWEYDNYDYESDSASVGTDFAFNLSDRRYTSSVIDLDDDAFVGVEPSTLAVWFWVPPDVRKGDSLQILDTMGTVTETDTFVWTKGLPKRVIEVVVRGTGRADPDYGDLGYTYVDRLYFDRLTGMFVAERYIEHDIGTYEGLSAEFDSHIKIDVTASSYGPEVDWGEFAYIYARNLTVIALVVLGVFYLAYRVRWAKRTFPVDVVSTPTGSGPGSWRIGGQRNIRLLRVWKVRDLPRLKVTATDHFGPFLEHWAEKNIRTGDRMAVAIDPAARELYGFALFNNEGQIGTVLCKDTETNETLRRYIKAKDFFCEQRHTYKGNMAYNIFETQTVYRLDAVPDVTYDASVVRPMTDADLRVVAGLARRVYRSRAARWVRACHASGDLGYVAVVDGRIVGFGFACVCGTHGRLHTLGVDPAYRGRGLAKQLHKARLHAMGLMGVTDVVDEIAEWNLASIRISTLSGFRPVGKMYVQTVRKRRVKKNIVRR